MTVFLNFLWYFQERVDAGKPTALVSSFCVLQLYYEGSEKPLVHDYDVQTHEHRMISCDHDNLLY